VLHRLRRRPRRQDPAAVADRVLAQRLTYLPRERLLALADHARAACDAGPGDLVECGVALGGSAAVLPRSSTATATCTPTTSSG
jgi:hypothetical protein